MASAPFPTFDPNRFNPLRAFLRWSGRRALRWFYRETVVIQVGVVPETGPVLFIGNHPNDLPDVRFLDQCYIQIFQPEVLKLATFKP